MKYVVVMFLIAFSLVGLLLLLAGLKGLWNILRRWPFLKSVVGEIVSVEQSQSLSSKDDPGTVALVAFRPVVRFTTAEGEMKQFCSATGKLAATSPYSIGTSVPVLYDPDNEIPPMLHTWFAMWGVKVACLLGGLVFLGGAALTYAAFGDRVFNGP